MKEAPLFAQSLALAQWLLQNLTIVSPLRERIQGHALDLLEHLTLALKGFDREERVDQADRSAALARVTLRLAHELGQLDEDRFLFLAEQLDGIGRQTARAGVLLEPPRCGPLSGAFQCVQGSTMLGVGGLACTRVLRPDPATRWCYDKSRAGATSARAIIGSSTLSKSSTAYALRSSNSRRRP